MRDGTRKFFHTCVQLLLRKVVALVRSGLAVSLSELNSMIQFIYLKPGLNESERILESIDNHIGFRMLAKRYISCRFNPTKMRVNEN